MNAVEIEQAVSELAERPFNLEELLVQFVAAFGNKDTTLKRLHPGRNHHVLALTVNEAGP